MPSAERALLSPACRTPNSNGTSSTRRFRARTRISSRILKPRGRRRSSGTLDRRRRKKPLIGSLTRRRRRGNRIRAAPVEASDRAARPALKFSSPPLRYRLATTTSTSPASARASRSGTTAGGCWRSPSITHTQSARAACRPRTTAPERPSVRSRFSRWIRTIESDRCPRSDSTISGVLSSLSSTNTTSEPLGSASSRPSSSGRMLPASFLVGTITDSAGRGRAAGWWPFDPGGSDHFVSAAGDSGSVCRVNSGSFRRPRAGLSSTRRSRRSGRCESSSATSPTRGMRATRSPGKRAARVS